MNLRKSHLLLILIAFGLPGLRAAQPVEFRFSVPEAGITNPFARQIQAEVILPSGARIALPAFVSGPGAFAVRARPVQAGTYALGAITEALPGGKIVPLTALPLGDDHQIVAVEEVERLPAVQVNSKNHHQFVRSDGVPFLPIGANLAWPESAEPGEYYAGVMPKFASAHLTWMRVWMAHWSGMNLDWLPPRLGPSPKPPALDLDVAAQWDRIVDAADDNGVYLQIVLQHHGQYTTYNDSNWAENPWNAANPDGWLKQPTDFFTDPKARLLTMLKYRYIVARWGWSPAIFAWELFNEVHWTNAMREGHEDLVGKWHGDMADAIRACDVYGHMLTTSTENLRSPVYAKMDFYQPHLYPLDLLTAARTFDPDPRALDRPVFYGESGDENAGLPADQTAAGSTLSPPVWASLMGESQLPAQTWEGARMIERQRRFEIGAVHMFWAATGMGKRSGLTPFSPFVYCLDHTSLVIKPAVQWLMRPPADFTMPIDGTLPTELGNWSAIYASAPKEVARGFPTQSTIRFSLPEHTVMRATVTGAGGNGSADLNFILDGQVVGSGSWTAATAPSAQHPAEIEFPARAGQHTLVIRNAGGGGWAKLSSLDFGVDVGDLAALGVRRDDFIAVWIYRRDQVWSDTGGPTAGVLELHDVPAGQWSVSWYNPETGECLDTRTMEHFGGTLKLPTPNIAHDAVLAVQSLSRR